MKIKKLSSGIFIFIIISTYNLYSQGSFRIDFGLLLPVMNYASDDPDNENWGGANMGIGSGIQYLVPVNKSGLSFFTGIDLFFNTYNKTIRDKVEEINNQLVDITNPEFISSEKYSNKFSKMINIPISAGLNYKFISFEKISFFGSAGFAFGFYKCTDYVIIARTASKVEEFTITTDMAKSLGGKIGFGMLVNDKTSIRINYLGFFKYDLVVNCTGENLSEKFKDKKEVDMLNISLGFKF